MVIPQNAIFWQSMQKYWKYFHTITTLVWPSWLRTCVHIHSIKSNKKICCRSICMELIISYIISNQTASVWVFNEHIKPDQKIFTYKQACNTWEIKWVEKTLAMPQVRWHFTMFQRGKNLCLRKVSLCYQEEDSKLRSCSKRNSHLLTKAKENI